MRVDYVVAALLVLAAMFGGLAVLAWITDKLLTPKGGSK